MSLEYIQEMSGHSGCRVLLCRDGRQSFIRKKSSSPAYNERLKKQWVKQKLFSADAVKTPEVLEAGYEDGLFYFDMEYVSARTMAEYVDRLEIDDILAFLDLLFHNLPLERGTPDPAARELFAHKISALADSLPDTEEIVLKAVQRLRDFDFSRVPRSWCCGDLTLENILVTENKHIYLIDFLDSFYNSWMIDVAKLFQDLEFQWSFRKLPKNIHRELKLLIAREVLLKKVLDKTRSVHVLCTIYHIVLLNTLRILPYTRDDETRRYLNRTLAAIMRRIDEIKEYL